MGGVLVGKQESPFSLCGFDSRPVHVRVDKHAENGYHIVMAIPA